jgi:hypothetical protein
VDQGGDLVELPIHLLLVGFEIDDVVVAAHDCTFARSCS